MLGIGIIGAGAIALQNHVPGIPWCRDARLAAVCDSDPAALERAVRQTGVTGYAEWRRLLEDPAVAAVMVATPNHTHAEIVIAAARAGRHVLCEKPLAMDLAQAQAMLAAVQAAGVRHMTAFTYRFVPAMRYMAHLVRSGDIGRPWHFRAARLQDWDRRPLGWRQVAALAATGEMGDMLSHRIDYGHLLLGPMRRVCADLARLVDQRGGQPSDVDDWVAMLAQFACGATGVLESSKLATGRGEGWRSLDQCEVNGSEGTLVYELSRPWELRIGRRGEHGLRTVPVPDEMLKHPDSTRDAHDGDPLVSFRYDQVAEFVSAIQHGRPCSPSLADGVAVQAVMEAALESQRQQRWVDVPWERDHLRPHSEIGGQP